MAEGGEIPKLKESRRPDIQAQVVEEAESLRRDFPEAPKETVIKRARSTIAKLLRIKRLREQTLRHEEAANTDSLTGLLNRAGLDKRLSEEAIKARRLGYNLFLIVLDLNGLKELNDNLGHEEGDKLLKSTGNILRLGHGTRAETDFAARVGGDEFWVVLAEKPTDNPRDWWDRVKQDFIQNSISFAAGLSKVDIRKNGFNPEAVRAEIEKAKRQADQRMYDAKAQSKSGSETCIMAGEYDG